MARRPTKKSDSPNVLIIAVAVAALAVGALLVTLSRGGAGDVESAVRDVIENNPQLIMDAFQKGRAKQEQQRAEEAQKNISKHRAKLEQNKDIPFIGNEKGDVVVVEFFDYSCGYCKRVIDDVASLVEQDKNVKFVLVDFPILGPGSEIASRAALAVHVTEPKKYFAFHSALMKFQGQKTEEKVLAEAKKLGLNVPNIKEEMKSSKVTALLAANRELGRAVGVNGTPAFIVGGVLTPGAMNLDQMKAAVASARKN